MDLTGLIGVPYSGERFCAVFAAQVLARHGIPYPTEVSRPEDAPDWVRVERPQPLDVVVFLDRGKPGHVGVCIGRGRFIHVDTGKTSRIEHLTSPAWASRIEGFYRYSR